MKYTKTLFILSILSFLNFSLFGQSIEEIDSMITIIAQDVKNSKNIKCHQDAIKVLDLGVDALSKLIILFPQTEITTIYSDCKNRYLEKGELAIILADRIEKMPYMTVTGIQNCTMSFCEDNDNQIEYYLILDNDFFCKEDFINKYSNWLKSNDRKEMIERHKIN